MLNLIMAAMLSYQASPQRGPPPPPPVMHSHREAYFVRPLSTTLTSEWQCEGARRPSMARIAVTSYFDEQRRQRFRVSLEALRVNGRAASRQLFERISRELSVLEGVTFGEGRCRRNEQRMLIEGSVFDGARFSSRRLELTLVPEG